MALDWRKVIGLRGAPGKDDAGSTGLGPDLPTNRHMNERPSAYPRLLTVAVVNDDGSPIGTALVPNFDDLALEIRKLRLALTYTGFAADVDGDNFDDIT